MPLGTELGLGLRDVVFDVDPATPRKKGTPTPTQFLAHVYCGQMAEWMTGSQLPRKGHSSPLFSAHVYCGDGRLSQLLLSSCWNSVITMPQLTR